MGSGRRSPRNRKISGSASVLVFPSSYHVVASGTLDGRRLTVTSTVDKVDLAKVEALLAAGTWTGDPHGAPVEGAPVQATVTELIPRRTKVGSDYDFIEKVSRPRYEYSIDRRVVKSLDLVTHADGRVAFDLTVPSATHQYEVSLATHDRIGSTEQVIDIGTPDPTTTDAGLTFLDSTGADVYQTRYGIGDRVALHLSEAGRPVRTNRTDRYLYIVANAGLTAATISDTPTFERTFGAADAPTILITATRFTGHTYSPTTRAYAEFDTSERAIHVTLTADRAHYLPGQDVALAVTTTDASGRPVAASVVLQAVDQKLYQIGGAHVPDALTDLYANVGSGILRVASTHKSPTIGPEDFGGGDTTGGGGRDDFRDTLTFQMVRTDATGHAALTIKLSDDLTSWHVSAIAFTAALQAGVGELVVPVGLPMFVEATIADDYLLADRPIIGLRAFGASLQAGDPVEYTVRSTSLGLAPVTVTGTAFNDTPFELPPLLLGDQTLDITVVAKTRSDGAGKPLSDRLIRHFGVVTSRLTTADARYLLVGDPLPTVATSDAATYTFTDAGRGRYLPLLLAQVAATGGRFDDGLATSMARGLLIDTFGRDPAMLPPSTFDPYQYPVGVYEDDNGQTEAGLALLPYGGRDPWLAARIAVLAPDSIRPSDLRDVLVYVRDQDATRRDLWIAAVAGLASLGEPVVADLETARTVTDLTIGERLDLALGYAALGDEQTARQIERELLTASGQQLGPWVRLHVGDADETAEATARMAVLAASLGDPLAPNMIDYAVDHRSSQTSQSLELVAATARALERTPATAASFAYTVDGRRTVVDLGPGESTTISLTAAQRAGLSVERLSGNVGIAVSWRKAADPTTLRPDPALTLLRSLPTSPIPADQLVTIDLTASFDPAALDSGCYLVVEELPSGLAPVERYSGSEPGIVWPSSIVGQRVTFCVGKPGPKGALSAHLRYTARVVNAGTFTWESATMQLPGVPDAVAVAPGGTVRVGGA